MFALLKLIALDTAIATTVRSRAQTSYKPSVMSTVQYMLYHTDRYGIYLGI